MRMRKSDRARFERDTVKINEFERTANKASEGAMQAMILRALEREQAQKHVAKA